MIAAPRRRRLSADDRRNLRTALPFIAPWIIGFVAFTLYPIVYSLYLSFTKYSGFGDATPAGFDNFKYMATDPLFWQSLGNTMYYTVLAVPIGVVVAIALALMMNQNLRDNPGRPPPDIVYLYAQLILTPPPDAPSGRKAIWPSGPAMPLARWFPGTPPPPGSLPLQAWGVPPGWVWLPEED